MSETPWTPGPWDIELDDLEVDTPAYHLNVGPVGIRLAAKNPTPRNLADARLIAAAPEMADLLMAPGTYPDHEWTDRRDALLSRIRGEAPSPTPDDTPMPTEGDQE